MNEDLKLLFEDLDTAVDRGMESHEPDIHAITNAIEALKDYLTANPTCNNTYHSKYGYDCCN
jgi:hypothetical protein